MTEEGITVWLAALNPSVLQCIRSSALAERLGRERLLSECAPAIRKYQESDLSPDEDDEQASRDAAGRLITIGNRLSRVQFFHRTLGFRLCLGDFRQVDIHLLVGNAVEQVPDQV